MEWRYGDGHRATTRFQYDGADMIAEHDGSNALLRRYVHGPGQDEPLVWYEGAGTSDRRWLVSDRLGSVIAVTDASGAATAINTYDEYGVPGASNLGRFGYTGQTFLPEAAAYYYKARVYAPSLGRFLQTDPILYDGGMNLYAYVGNDPVNATDPWGLQTTEEEIVVTGTRIRRPRVDPNERINDFGNRGGLDLGGAAGCGLFMAYADDSIRCGGGGVSGPPPGFVPASGAVEDATFEFVSLVLPEIKLGAAAVGWLGRLAAQCSRCLVEGTDVSTPDGLRPIEEIEVGDMVLAWNEETGEVAPKLVTALIRPLPQATFALQARDAGGDLETFRASADHPWRVEGKGWVETVNLMPGDRIDTADGADLLVQSLVATGQIEQTYNLTVADWSTFLVGDDGAVVHNCWKIFRHVFNTHGARRPIEQLLDRARSTGKPQGQFANDAQAAAFLRGLPRELSGQATFTGLPGRVIHPNGTITSTNRVLVVTRGDGIRSAYPVP